MTRVLVQEGYPYWDSPGWSPEKRTFMTRTDLYADSDKVLINGKEYSGDISLKEVLRITKANVGNFWGVELRPGYHLGDGAVFQIVLDGDEVSVQFGDRGLIDRRMTQDDNTNLLWTKIYQNGVNNALYVGKATPEQKREILQVDHRALIFRKEHR